MKTMPRIDSTPTTDGAAESLRRPPRQTPLLGLFLLSGILASSWIARVPAVRDALGLTAAELGVLLPLSAVGAIAAVSVAAPILTRFGGERTLAASTFGHAIAFTLLGLGPALGSTPLLVAGLIINGAAFALGNLPLNVESAGLERRAGRAILPRFHAGFSLGTVIGSLIGVVCAATGVAVLTQFLATAALAIVWRLAALRSVVHDTRRGAVPATITAPEPGTGASGATAGAAARNSTSAWRESRALLLGLVVLSAAIYEGAANDWLSLAIVDGFGQSDAVGAAVFGVFVASMTLIRVVGTRITDRIGRTAVLRASAASAAVGLLLFATAPVMALAIVGVVAWGCGTGLVVPLAISAASDDPTRAASRVAVVTGLASFASLAAPPLLGLAAQAMGPRLALLLVVVVVAVVAALSHHVAPAASVPAEPAQMSAHRARLVRHRGIPGAVRARILGRSIAQPTIETRQEPLT